MQAIELVDERHENVREAQVIERFDGYCEAQEIPFGVVYRWCPESFVVQCGCGKRPVLTATVTTCRGCEANHMALVRKRRAIQPLMTDEIRHLGSMLRAARTSAYLTDGGLATVSSYM